MCEILMRQGLGGCGKIQLCDWATVYRNLHERFSYLESFKIKKCHIFATNIFKT